MPQRRSRHSPKFSPDICLEVFDSNQQCHPEILIFDPTIGQRNSILMEKHEYAKSIRCFNCWENILDNNENKRIVKESWAVSPENTSPNIIDRIDENSGNIKLDHLLETQQEFEKFVYNTLLNKFDFSF